MGFRIMTVLTLTTGTAFIMWLGEQITERGIGNGISLIIFAGIVVGLPHASFGLIDDIRTGQRNLFAMIGLVVFMIAVVAFVVFMERAQRRIPVQYAKRVVGRKVYGGSNTYLPLRVNTAGVIPVIFASSIMVIPQTLATMIKTPWATAIGNQIRVGEPLYYLLQFVGIIFFGYFYTSIVFNPVDTADNMRKYGGFIPGIRPGKKTSDYIDRVLTRITARRVDLPGRGLPAARVPHRRHPCGAAAVRNGRSARPGSADLVHGRHGIPVLLRRHIASHRGRRGHGHDPADRVAAGHAPLRRVHETRACPRTPRIRGRGREADFHRSPRQRKRDAGSAAGRASRSSAYLHRRHAA